MDDAGRNRTLIDIDRESVFHGNTSIADHNVRGASIIASGSGSRVRDYAGKSYLDALAGLWCVNAGYGRQELADAGAKSMAELGYFHTFAHMANPPNILLAEKVLQLLRDEADCGHLVRVFFANSGSEANDTAFKLARYINNLRGLPKKKKLIARRGAYHGISLGSGSLTGIDYYHKAFDLPLEGVIHISCPHHFGFAEPGESEEAFTARLIAELEAVIEREGAETIAAFFAEPIMGAGGVMMPPKGYFEAIQPILKANDILFVVDEVICGYGRTGSWFGSGTYNLKPDLLCFAKGVTSGYFPVSGVVVSQGVWDILAEGSKEIGAFAHGYTYSGHPVGGAVGLANLAVLENEGLIQNAAEVGAYFKAQLDERFGEHPRIGEIRGKGLILGVEFVADRASGRKLEPGDFPHRRVAAAAFERGLITRAMAFAPVNAFSPPLIYTRADVDETVDLYAASLKDVFGV
jgi:L-2,4-diaminobutyrate transaminase